jgi:hypothetical protein
VVLETETSKTEVSIASKTLPRGLQGAGVMFRYGLTVWLAATFGFPPLLQEDIDALLGNSEKLYYEATFEEFLELSTAFDSPIPSDEEKNPSSVVAVIQETKAELENNRCNITCDTISSRLVSRETGLTEQFPMTANKECGCVLALLKDAAEQSFQDGVEAYKEDNLATAAKNFRDAIKLQPEHSLAIQYLALTKAKLRLEVEQRLLVWQQIFQSGDFGKAAAGYREIVSLNVDGLAEPALKQLRTAYRQAVTRSVDAWNRSCKVGDTASMDRARSEAALILPDQVIGQDLLDQMATCTSKPCVQMDVQAAMLRLKTSIKPELPPNLETTLQNPLTRNVRVEARIDENGDVSVRSVRGENTAINNIVHRAVEAWKFTPAILDNEPRCVETVLPIVITPSRPN